MIWILKIDTPALQKGINRRWEDLGTWNYQMLRPRVEIYENDIGFMKPHTRADAGLKSGKSNQKRK